MHSGSREQGRWIRCYGGGCVLNRTPLHYGLNYELNALWSWGQGLREVDTVLVRCTYNIPMIIYVILILYNIVPVSRTTIVPHLLPKKHSVQIGSGEGRFRREEIQHFGEGTEGQERRSGPHHGSVDPWPSSTISSRHLQKFGGWRESLY